MQPKWSFIIKGEDESELHGKTYRLLIKKTINKNAFGYVRNIKHKAEIEVCLVAIKKRDAEKLKIKIQNELINAKAEGLNFGKLYKFEDDIKYENFEIVREDELTEMVWALQGAGQIFLESAKKQDIILKTLRRRDSRKEEGLLLALSYEARGILRRLSNLEEEIKILGKTKKIPLIHVYALQKALVEPPWTNRFFMRLTYDLFYSIKNLDPVFITLNKREQLRKLKSVNIILNEYYGLVDRRLRTLAFERRHK